MEQSPALEEVDPGADGAVLLRGSDLLIHFLTPVHVSSQAAGARVDGTWLGIEYVGFVCDVRGVEYVGCVAEWTGGGGGVFEIAVGQRVDRERLRERLREETLSLGRACFAFVFVRATVVVVVARVDAASPPPTDLCHHDQGHRRGARDGVKGGAGRVSVCRVRGNGDAVVRAVHDV